MYKVRTCGRKERPRIDKVRTCGGQERPRIKLGPVVDRSVQG